MIQFSFIIWYTLFTQRGESNSYESCSVLSTILREAMEVLRLDKITVYSLLMILYFVMSFRLFRRHRIDPEPIHYFYIITVLGKRVGKSSSCEQKQISKTFPFATWGCPTFFNLSLIHMHMQFVDFGLDIGSYLVETLFTVVFSLSNCWFPLWVVGITKLSTCLDLITCQLDREVKYSKFLETLHPLIRFLALYLNTEYKALVTPRRAGIVCISR